MTGYDRYLEFQFGWSGDFTQALFQAIARADSDNLAKLSEGFPQEVDAYILWSQHGAKALAAKVSPSHPLVRNLVQDYPETAEVFGVPEFTELSTRDPYDYVPCG